MLPVNNHNYTVKQGNIGPFFFTFPWKRRARVVFRLYQKNKVL